jgi:asparagine synthase (glutamine-hydrolysing)
MCGIAGIVKFNASSPEVNQISNMIAAMKHRGPDDENYFIEDQTALGHVRLSIIDLSKDGQQPFFSSNGRYVMVFNGEIYNYREIKLELEDEFDFKTATDSEVLLNAYIKWGDQCMHKFNGMFAFAIYDKENKTLFCSRDRFGVKPFYYYHDDEKLIFASEPISILSILSNKPKPDYQTIFDFLVFNRADTVDSSFFADIKKLKHGHQLKIENKKISISKWYDLSKNLNSFSNPDDYIEQLTKGTDLRLRSDVPVGLTLSGGLDSSAIAGILINKLDKADINTFSAVYDKAVKVDESNFIDLFKGQMPNMNYLYPTTESLFESLNAIVETQQEPFNTTSIYANYFIMQNANKTVKVMLNGQGADEHLAGYHYFFGNYYKELFTKLKWGTLAKETMAYWQRYHSTYAFKTFAYYLIPSFLKTSVRTSNTDYLDNNFAKAYSGSNNVVDNLDNSDSLNQALLNHFEYKLEHLLKWDDRNSMRFGIESRNPFLDFRLVEGTVGMAPDFKIKDGLTKKILRDCTKGIMPEEIRMRMDKVGFATPEDEWFRTPIFSKFISKILNSESFKNRGIINPNVANQMYQNHLDKKINISKEIWKWTNLELWFQKFID